MREDLFLIETLVLYGLLLGFAVWEVVKMRRHAARRKLQDQAARAKAENTAPQPSEQGPGGGDQDHQN